MATIFDETDADLYDSAIARASSQSMSIATLLEAAIVIEARGGEAAEHALDVYIGESNIELAPVSLEHAPLARRAERRRLFRLNTRRKSKASHSCSRARTSS